MSEQTHGDGTAGGVREIRQVRYRFEGASVLLTGSARGQGRSHALAFARAGANVALLDAPGELATTAYAMSAAEDLERTAQECRDLGVKVVSSRCDVRDAAQVREGVSAALAAFGRLDVIVCNAGIASLHEVVDLPEQAWDELIDTNLKGVFLTCKYGAPSMIENGSGSIVVTGSTASQGGYPYLAHYVAAKHGIAGFVKAFSTELAPHHVRINYVCPTAVETPMLGSMADPSLPADIGERMLAVTGSWNLLEEGQPPLQPIEITQAVLWLASDASKYVTGSALLVDAGFLAK